MLRPLTTLLALIGSMAAAAAQADKIVPTGISDVGPWEAVIWTKAGQVDHCTMSRARAAPPGISYAWYADDEVVLLGIETRSWRFQSASAVELVLQPQQGSERRLSARPVSSSRANVQLGEDRSLLDDLQRSEHLDVRFGALSMRLAFDDFNAARVVLEACRQRIGKPFQGQRR
jgi:hypothetical protein